jgi:hypothetical protein
LSQDVYIQGVAQINSGSCIGCDSGGHGEGIYTTISDFKKAVIQILRSLCVMTQTLHPLPKRKYLFMQLHYYDEITPFDYNPPFFEQSKMGPLYFDDDKKAIKMDFGTISSPFHKTTLRLQTTCDYLENDNSKDDMTVGGLPSESVKNEEPDSFVMSYEIPLKQGDEDMVSCLCGVNQVNNTT